MNNNVAKKFTEHTLKHKSTPVNLFLHRKSRRVVLHQSREKTKDKREEYSRLDY